MSALAELRDDLVTSVRALRRQRAFGAAALTVLAVGLGAAGGLAAIVHSVLLRPLPYEAPERIVAAWFVSPTLPGALDRVRHSKGTYLHWRDRNQAYEAFALAERASLTLEDGGRATRVDGAVVTSDLHAVLGREAAAGRSLRAADMAPGAEPVVLLTDGLWAERYGRAPSAIGSLVTLDGIQRRVVGVLPPEVRFPDEGVRLWLPLEIDEAAPDALNFLYTGYGRLAPGQDLAASEADFMRLVDLLPEVMPQAFPRAILERAQFRPLVVPLERVVLGETLPVLALLGGAALLLLGIVGANFASLTVVRTDRRLRGLAVRAASGATAGRLKRLLVGESLLLAWLGAALGLAVAAPLLAAFGSSGSDLLPRISQIGLTPASVMATLLAATALGAAAGLASASRFGASALASSLRGGTRAVGERGARTRLRHVLVVAQVALAVVLAMDAGLLVRSFQRLVDVDAGFDPVDLLTASIALDERGYPDWEAARSLVLPLVDEISGLDGVTAVSLSNHLPLREGRIFRPFVVEDVPRTAELPEPQLTRVVSDGYFEALGIPLAAGRALDRDDLLLDRPAIVVSAGLAEAWWPGESALGRRLSYGFDVRTGEPEWLEVVGVAEDVRDRELRSEAPGLVYVPLQPRHLTGNRWREISVAVRGGDPLGRVAAIRGALTARDPSVPLYGVRTMGGVIGDATRRDRLVTLILSGAAGVALLLAAVGLYGLLSFVVALRRREIGLRLALGAEPAEVRRLVVGRAWLLVGAGLAVGAALAASTSRLLSEALFRTPGLDPLALAGVLTLLAAVSAAASYGPARRASNLSPILTLEEE